jgi:hypothetical protein
LHEQPEQEYGSPPSPKVPFIKKDEPSSLKLGFSKKGFNVDSYGTNSVIKIPGPAADKPNSYPFGITYDDIYQDLLAKDPNL